MHGGLIRKPVTNMCGYLNRKSKLALVEFRVDEKVWILLLYVSQDSHWLGHQLRRTCGIRVPLNLAVLTTQGVQTLAGTSNLQRQVNLLLNLGIALHV